MRVLMPLTGTWDWPSKIAGNWDCLPKISWDFGICQNSRIIGWDCKNSSNWELGFGLKINWELGLSTPHHDPHRWVEAAKERIHSNSLISNWIPLLLILDLQWGGYFCSSKTGSPYMKRHCKCLYIIVHGKFK